MDAADAGAVVPDEFVDDERIVLNVSYAATQEFVIGNDLITFQARFGGKPFDVSIPVMAVVAIYARETGEGMMFTDAGDTASTGTPGDDSRDDGSPDDTGGPDRSHLRVIK